MNSELGQAGSTWRRTCRLLRQRAGSVEESCSKVRFAVRRELEVSEIYGELLRCHSA